MTEHIDRIYDDRNRVVGWVCKCCGRRAAYLSQVMHSDLCLIKPQIFGFSPEVMEAITRQGKVLPDCA